MSAPKLDLAAIRQRVDAATGGPWVARIDVDGECDGIHVKGSRANVAVLTPRRSGAAMMPRPQLVAYGAYLVALMFAVLWLVGWR